MTELFDIACLMAQELQEYVDAGEESGSNMDATKGLLDDWEIVYRNEQSCLLTLETSDEQTKD